MPLIRHFYVTDTKWLYLSPAVLSTYFCEKEKILQIFPGELKPFTLIKKQFLSLKVVFATFLLVYL